MVALKDYRNDFRLSLIDCSNDRDWSGGYDYGILLDGHLKYKSNCKEHCEVVYEKIRKIITDCISDIDNCFGK